GHDQPFHPAERHIFCHLDNTHVALVADRRARYEYGAALDFGKAHSVRGVVGDLAPVNFIFDKLHCKRRSFFVWYPYYITPAAHTAIGRSDRNAGGWEKTGVRRYPVRLSQCPGA